MKGGSTMRIEHLKEYMNLCIKFNISPSWNGLSIFKTIKKGTH